MIPDLGLILPLLESFYKKPSPSCPRCKQSSGCIKWGRYWRYSAGCARRIGVQRYRCQNTDCSITTFSILPFGLLPYLRIGFLTLWLLVSPASLYSVNSRAKFFDCSRATIRRRTAWGLVFFAWLGESLHFLRGITWNAFCGLIFARFFPVAAARSTHQHNSANSAPGADFVISGARR